MSKILIIKLGALGDVVMASSLIKQIQAFHSQDQIYLLTSNAFVDLFIYWENLKVIAFPRKGIIATIKTICWIRNNKFLRLYDLQSNDRTRLLTALSGISQRVGNHPAFPYNIHPPDKYTGQKHIYSRMLDVLTSAGIKPAHVPPELPSSKKEKEKIAGWFKDKNIEQKKFVIIHAGSSPKHPEKRWPYYKELAKKLEMSGYKIVFIGSEADKDFNKLLSADTGIDASGEFSIIEIAELGSHACFAITNDSGPMHVLSCSGIPVYSFFGPTNWKRNHSVGQEKNVFSTENNKPLNTISLETVLGRLSKDGLIKNY